MIAVAVGGYIFFKKSSAPAQSAETNIEQQKQEQAPAASSQQNAGNQNGQNQSNQNQKSENAVLYMNSGYSPAVLKIKFGDVVTFRNASSQLMWTASDPHPAHGAYPVKGGGCSASAFDQCEALSAGLSWSFQFTAAGTWQYHNHLNPRHTGVIIVE